MIIIGLAEGTFLAVTWRGIIIVIGSWRTLVAIRPLIRGIIPKIRRRTAIVFVARWPIAIGLRRRRAVVCLQRRSIVAIAPRHILAQIASGTASISVELRGRPSVCERRGQLHGRVGRNGPVSLRDGDKIALHRDGIVR